MISADDFAFLITVLFMVIDLGIVYLVVRFIRRQSTKRKKMIDVYTSAQNEMEALIRSTMGRMAHTRLFLGGNDNEYRAPVHLAVDVQNSLVLSMCDLCSTVFNFDMMHFVHCRCACHSPHDKKFGQIFQKRPEIMQYRWTYCSIVFLINPLPGMAISTISKYGFHIPIPFMKNNHSLVIQTHFKSLYWNLKQHHKEIFRIHLH